jgi:hypothetical protein
MSEQPFQDSEVKALIDLGNAVGKALADWAKSFQSAMNGLAEWANRPEVKAAIEQMAADRHQVPYSTEVS